METKLISTAEAPQRSTGTITLSWGLMNMSLSLYSATEKTDISRKEFVEGDTNRPAGRAIIDKSTGSIVDFGDVKRLVQATNGAWVDVTDDEMASAIGVKNVAEVLTFVPAPEAAEAYVVESYNQVRPKATKGVMEPASAQAFALFTTVLEKRNLVALVRLSTRGPARYALVTATGDLFFINSSDEVRKPRSMDLPEVNLDHLRVANQLVDAIGITLPVLPNETAAKIQAIADAKATGMVVEAPQASNAHTGMDLVDQLLLSIDIKKAANPWGAPQGAPVKTDEVAA